MKHVVLTFISIISIAAFAACGPGNRNGGGGGGGDVDGGGGGGGGGGAENTPAACSDGMDNDGDGLVDCMDPDCSGMALPDGTSCPVCGTVDHPTGQPLALPDGVCGASQVDDDDSECACTGGASSGATTATCSGQTPSGEQCFTVDADDGDVCRISYTSTLMFSDFGATQTFSDPSNIQSVCIVAEHSWIRDLEIQLIAPDGKVVQLQKFLGRNPVTEIYLGHANDCDDDASPVAGTGDMYCFKPNATRPSPLDYINAGGTLDSVPGGACPEAEGMHDMLPAGDYAAADPWTKLIGSPLNGAWSLQVTDLWPVDNGYLFSWSLSFDPSIAQSCSSPPIQ